MAPIRGPGQNLGVAGSYQWSGCTVHIMPMVLIPALCIVMLINIAVAEFSTPVKKCLVVAIGNRSIGFFDLLL